MCHGRRDDETIGGVGVHLESVGSNREFGGERLGVHAVNYQHFRGPFVYGLSPLQLEPVLSHEEGDFPETDRRYDELVGPGNHPRGLVSEQGRLL